MATIGGPVIPGVTEGLVLYLDAANEDSYPGTGTAWKDLSGRNNNATLTNGPVYSGKNKAANFSCDGVNDRINVPKSLNGFTYNIHYDLNWTIECWMYTNPYKASPQTYKTIYGNYNGCNYNVYKGNAAGITLYSTTSSSTINLNLTYGPRNISPGSQCPDISVSWSNAQIGLDLWNLQNKWAHFVMSCDDGTTVKLFINGVQKGPTKTVNFKNSQNRIDNNLVATNNYSWGGDFTSNSANQLNFSVCKIYNRALTVAEVLKNYNATKSRFGL